LDGFLLEQYKNWIIKFFNTNGKKYNIIISFSGNDRKDEAERWKKPINNIKSGVIKNIVDLHVVRTKKNNRVSICEFIASTSGGINDKKKFEDFLTGQDRNLIIYDNHGDMAGYLKNNIGFIFQHYMGVDKGVNLFNLLSHPVNDEHLLQYLILKLLETALTNILIIDERVAEYWAEKIEKTPGEEQEYENLSLRQKIYVPFYIRFNQKEPVFISKKLEKIFNEEAFKDSQKKIFGIKFSEKGWELEQDKNSNKINFHISVIHQGVIDECIQPNSKNNNWFKNAYNTPSHIVITSGRGKFIKFVPDDLPFIEFSVLKSNLIDDFSKVHLVESLGIEKGGK